MGKPTAEEIAAIEQTELYKSCPVHRNGRPYNWADHCNGCGITRGSSKRSAGPPRSPAAAPEYKCVSFSADDRPSRTARPSRRAAEARGNADEAEGFSALRTIWLQPTEVKVQVQVITGVRVPAEEVKRLQLGPPIVLDSIRILEGQQGVADVMPAASPPRGRPPAQAAAADTGVKSSSDEDEGADTSDAYGIGLTLTEPIKKHMCKDDDSVLQAAEKYGVDPADVMQLNRGRRFGPELTIRSLLMEGAFLLVPDATEKFGSTVTKYLGIFPTDNCEYWEITDKDSAKHRIDADTLYRGLGYQTRPECPHMNSRIVRSYTKIAGTMLSEGGVVGYMPAGDEPGENALWLVMHDDGDREDLDEEELAAALRLAEERGVSGQQKRPQPAVSSFTGTSTVAKVNSTCADRPRCIQFHSG